MARYRKTKNKSNIVWTILGVMLILLVGSLLAGLYSVGDSPLSNDPQDNNRVLTTKEEGASATVGINAFTGLWGEVGTKTQVYPVYTIFVNGNTKLTDSNASSITGAVGQELDLYGTGATYYVDPILGFKIEGQSVNVPDIKAETIVGTTDLVIVAYDEDENVLTADDHVNNTADYNAGDVGTEEKTYFIKMKNNVKDETMRLGAILTYYCGDEADDFTLEETGWVSTSIPSGDLTKNFNLYDDTNASTPCSIKHAYVPSASDYISLKEFDDTGKLKFVFDADDTTEPSANGDTYFGAVFVDYACESSGSEILCDWYRHDSNSLPGGVGLNEAVTTTGFNGLDVGVAFEAQ